MDADAVHVDSCHADDKLAIVVLVVLLLFVTVFSDVRSTHSAV